MLRKCLSPAGESISIRGSAREEVAPSIELQA